MHMYQVFMSYVEGQAVEVVAKRGEGVARPIALVLNDIIYCIAQRSAPLRPPNWATLALTSLKIINNNSTCTKLPTCPTHTHTHTQAGH